MLNLIKNPLALLYRLTEVKNSLDQAQTSINELRLSNKAALASKCQAIYMEECQRTKKLAIEFERLYRQSTELEAKQNARESIKKGKIVHIQGHEEEEKEVNESIKEIERNPLLSQEQRKVRVEAEVNKSFILSI